MTKSSKCDQWFEQQKPESSPIEISVVVPAFNEERRLPPTLIEMIDYFDQKKTKYEILVVDDGSRDGTAEVVRRFERIRSQVRLVALPKNYGKGHAVRTGMLNAHGALRLFADADGSTPIVEIERVQSAIKEGADIAIGSRALASNQTAVRSRWYRKLLGRTFNFFVNTFLLPGITDTQCGFKMFTATSANFLFRQQRSDGWSFDLELLFLSRQTGLKVTEVAVNWNHVSGSKVNLALDSLRMFRDIFIFKFRHANLTAKSYQEFLQENAEHTGGK